ncbi:MAG: ABC transporter permease [bacterium]|nr:ABC transporter permease [bacterium]
MHRIYGIVLRYIYLMRHSFDRVMDIFYWVIMDIILWGFTSLFFRQAFAGDPNLSTNLIGGLILWYVVWRTQYEISVNLLEEVWNKNLINIFSSPISFTEWIVAFMINGIIKVLLMLGIASVVAYVLYDVNMLTYGPYLLLFILLLMMSGWVVGFIISSFILRFGTKLQNLAWSFPNLVNPFSAIFYPLSILPLLAQNIAHFIPTSYVFESARSLINTGYVDPIMLWKSFGLNVVYLIVSIFFVRIGFKKVLEKGLVKLY